MSAQWPGLWMIAKLWKVITAKIKFGILLCCLPIRFLIFSLVFLMFLMMYVKTSLLFCCFCIRLFQISMLLFVSVCCYAKARCYYLCPYAVMRKLDAIIRVRMLLFQTSMLLFVSICCYAKARCYYSCPYAVIPNLDAIIRVSNYGRLNPGLQRAWPLWSGASDKLIMPILPAERKFMLLSMAEVARKLSSNS